MPQSKSERREFIEYSLLDETDKVLVFSLLFTLGLFAIDYIRGHSEYVVLAKLLWPWIYVASAPIFVWRVRRREPAGDQWRSAAILAIGSLSCPLLFVPGAIPTAWPQSGLSICGAVAWGYAAQLLAMRATPPRQPAAVRIGLLCVGGVISGLIALPLFAGVGIGLLIGVWDPPPLAWLFSPVIVGLCLPLAVLAAYGSISMFREAARALRPG